MPAVESSESNEAAVATEDAIANVLAGLQAESGEGEEADASPDGEDADAEATAAAIVNAADGEGNAEEEEEEPTEADAITLPDGYAALPEVTEGLATEFALRGEDGEEYEVPALMVEYKANGKVRRDRLDQVVKLAQFGVYNQDREARIQQVEQAAREVDAERAELHDLLAEREAQLERLLTDDNFYLAVQEQYANENSPERRAERAEEQVQTLRVQQELSQISARGKQFQDQELEPALALLQQALPSITGEELERRVMVAMQAHLVQGPGGVAYLPESRYAAIRSYIVEDLAPWAQMVHQTRTEAQRDPEKERLASERDKARIEAQKAKRQIGQALKPVTRAAAPASSQPKSKPPATLDEAMDSAMAAVLATLR